MIYVFIAWGAECDREMIHPLWTKSWEKLGVCDSLILMGFVVAVVPTRTPDTRPVDNPFHVRLNATWCIHAPGAYFGPTSQDVDTQALSSDPG